MHKLLVSSFTLLLSFQLSAQNLKWAKNLGGISTTDKGNSVAIDAAGNVYTTGAFAIKADFDPGPDKYELPSKGGIDIFISKLDPDGNFLWAKSLGGTNDEWGFEIATDLAGNVYVAGSFKGPVDFDPSASGVFEMTGAGSSDAFILKLDPNGNYVWAKQLGGNGSDYAFSMCVDGSANVYTTGYFSVTADFDPGSGVFEMTAALSSKNTYISKLDSDGNFVWAKNIGGGSLTQPFAIAVDAIGNVYTTGIFRDAADFDPGPGNFPLLATINSQDAFVLKLDSDGNFKWAGRLGGLGTEQGNAIAVDAAGNVYSAGAFEGACDFDPLPSTPFILNSGGGYDTYISKLDANGKFVWAKSVGQSSADWPYGIAVDAAGNLYTTGYFAATADFDPGPGVFNLSAVGNFDVYVLKMTPNGEFVWAINIGGTAADGGESILLDAMGNIFVAGFFRNNCDFDPGSGSYNVQSNGLQDAFVLKLGQTNSDTENPNLLAMQPSLFPNPASESVFIHAPFSDLVLVKIHDALGRLRHTETLDNHSKTPLIIDIKSLHPGAYIVTLSSGVNVWASRFVKI